LSQLVVKRSKPRQIVKMSAAGFDVFMTAASRPAAPVPEMVDPFRRATPWEKASASPSG
jgi:uncharacterized protein (DUF1778 family)